MATETEEHGRNYISFMHIQLVPVTALPIVVPTEAPSGCLSYCSIYASALFCHSPPSNRLPWRALSWQLYKPIPEPGKVSWLAYIPNSHARELGGWGRV
jgi:hypothetical protein